MDTHTHMHKNRYNWTLSYTHIHRSNHRDIRQTSAVT